MAAGSLQRGSDPDIEHLTKRLPTREVEYIGRSCLETPPLTRHSETVLEILHQNKVEATLVYGQTS